MRANHGKCRRVALGAAGACLMVIASAISASAQAQAAPAPHPRSGFGRGGFIGAELFSAGKVVTGAPYAAQIVTEHIQTLADGNIIHTTATANVYRDSEGRTRQEITIGAIGPLAGQGAAQKMIFITDPVSGTNHVLNPDTLVARQMPFRARDRSELPLWQAGDARQKRANPDVQTESLGTQVIEGLSVQGTRITRTIPAGRIGNQQPIVAVTERWYSPELQIDVMRKQTNPRFGQTTFQLTNIVRGEPDPALFQVPPNYTLKSGRPLAGN